MTIPSTHHAAIIPQAVPPLPTVPTISNLGVHLAIKMDTYQRLPSYLNLNLILPPLLLRNPAHILLLIQAFSQGLGLVCRSSLCKMRPDSPTFYKQTRLPAPPTPSHHSRIFHLPPDETFSCLQVEKVAKASHYLRQMMTLRPIKTPNRHLPRCLPI